MKLPMITNARTHCVGLVLVSFIGFTLLALPYEFPWWLRVLGFIIMLVGLIYPDSQPTKADKVIGLEE